MSRFSNLKLVQLYDRMTEKLSDTQLYTLNFIILFGVIVEYTYIFQSLSKIYGEPRVEGKSSKLSLCSSDFLNSSMKESCLGMIKGSKNPVDKIVVLSDTFAPTEENCPSYGSKMFKQENIPLYTPGRAWMTVPQELTVKNSKIPNAGLGVFSRTFIKRFSWLGEYEGIVSHTRSRYDWLISVRGRPKFSWNANDTSSSNWLRWVNNPNTLEQLNTIALQCRHALYYIAIKDIAPGDELYVFYGVSYSKLLGMSDSEIDRISVFVAGFIGYPKSCYYNSYRNMNKSHFNKTL